MAKGWPLWSGDTTEEVPEDGGVLELETGGLYFISCMESLGEQYPPEAPPGVLTKFMATAAAAVAEAESCS